jgi:hypothetical protein
MPSAVAKRALFVPPNHSVIFKPQIPSLLPDCFSGTQRLRLSIGNAEEVLRGDQGMEMKKQILAAR